MYGELQISDRSGREKAPGERCLFYTYEGGDSDIHHLSVTYYSV